MSLLQQEAGGVEGCLGSPWLCCPQWQAGPSSAACNPCPCNTPTGTAKLAHRPTYLQHPLRADAAAVRVDLNNLFCCVTAGL